MVGDFKRKIGLNNVSYSVRAVQAVMQYGVGAMVDFPDQTLMTAAPELWDDTVRIVDERFAKALGVDYFALPSEISYTRFPEWYFCPKCRLFQPIGKWILDSKKTKKFDNDDEMVYHMRCFKCNQSLVAARIVTICEHGHINDFPWVKWVHARCGLHVCNSPSLTIKTLSSSTEGLEGIGISCLCGAYSTLQGAFDDNVFSALDKKNNTSQFLCEGRHPQKLVIEKCDIYPKTSQRGSSSVYFPLVYSSLVIPSLIGHLDDLVANSKSYYQFRTILDDQETNTKVDYLNSRLYKWIEQMKKEIGSEFSDVEIGDALRRKLLDIKDDEKTEISNIKYREEEYKTLTGRIFSDNHNIAGLSIDKMNVSDYKIPKISSISLINKISVVNALVGFSRIRPVESKNDHGFVHVKESNTNWYPAYKVNGEGIFIEIDQNSIDEWIKNNPKVIERVKLINENYNNSLIGKDHPRELTPKFIFLHTLSHLLIKQLSFECGYSISSLSERIYCSDNNSGVIMSAILIYTASGDSEGTLGGLVRQGRPDSLLNIFKKAIISAKSCSNDPICSLSHGQGRESLNLAACHVCTLLPETCCEERNRFLDRGMIIGTFEDNDIGFYSMFNDSI